MKFTNKNHYYIYVYLNPLKPGNYNYNEFHFDFEPFYVGKGSKYRLYSHIKEAKNKDISNYKLNTIRKILKNIEEKEFYKYILKIKENLLEFCAVGYEMYLIKLIGRTDLKTGPLTNLREGGDGAGQKAWNKGLKKENDKRVEKYSISISKKLNETGIRKGKNHPSYGKHLSIETKNKISKTEKGKKTWNKNIPMKEKSKEKLKNTILGSKVMFKEKKSKLVLKNQIEKFLNEGWKFGSLKKRVIKKKECPYCYNFFDCGNYSQHHGEKCKLKKGSI